MENIAVQKEEIIRWVNSVDDPKILDEISRFSKEKPFDFEAEMKKAITAEELKKSTTEFIKSLNWKK